MINYSETLKQEVQFHSQTAYIAFEPGDGTRYRFTIAPCDSVIGNSSFMTGCCSERHMLFGISWGHGKTIVYPINKAYETIRPGYHAIATPENIMKKFDQKNPWTGVVVVWFIKNMVPEILILLGLGPFNGDVQALPYGPDEAEDLGRFLDSELTRIKQKGGE